MTVEIPTGIPMPTIEPASPEWYRRMSASKIAGVVGLSQFESRFSVWCRMSGLLPYEPETDVQRRGHYLEPAVAAWFADQVPEVTVVETGTFAHPERDWQIATPDRLVYYPSGHVELLQCKSSAEDEKWGEEGTDEIPPGYRAQVMWEMDTTGLSTCHVAAILPRLEFRRYTVAYDAEEAAFLRDQALEFMASLVRGERPDLDAHTATYRTLRALHPDIADYGEEVGDIGQEWMDAVADAAVMTERVALAKARLLDAMGPAKRALVAGRAVARRQSGRGGAVSLYQVKEPTEKAGTRNGE